jgi:hypothetical protein
LLAPLANLLKSEDISTSERSGGRMRKSWIVIALCSTMIVAASATENVVKWKEIVGIIQPENVVGSGTGAIMGGFLPWTTTLGVAHVNLATGRLQFLVKGLVLAGGNNIGTRADITGIKGVLVCDTDGSAGGGNSTVVQSPIVALSLEGDAHFSGDLGELPSVCSTEPDLAFLIRIAELNGVPIDRPWIANGAVRLN